MSDNLLPLFDYLAGHFFSLLRLHERAIRRYQAATAGAPDKYEAWRCLGYLYQSRGRSAEAIAALERSLQLKPDDAITRFNLGFILHGQNQLDRAQRHLHEAIRLDPQLDRAWYGIGLIHNARGEFEQGCMALEEAARLQPYNPHASYHLAVAYRALGERDKLLTEYQRVREFDPKMAQQFRRDFGLPA